MCVREPCSSVLSFTSFLLYSLRMERTVISSSSDCSSSKYSFVHFKQHAEEIKKLKQSLKQLAATAAGAASKKREDGEAAVSFCDYC